MVAALTGTSRAPTKVTRATATRPARILRTRWSSFRWRLRFILTGGEGAIARPAAGFASGTGEEEDASAGVEALAEEGGGKIPGGGAVDYGVEIRGDED